MSWRNSVWEKWRPQKSCRQSVAVIVRNKILCKKAALLEFETRVRGGGSGEEYARDILWNRIEIVHGLEQRSYIRYGGRGLTWHALGIQMMYRTMKFVIRNLPPEPRSSIGLDRAKRICCWWKTSKSSRRYSQFPVGVLPTYSDQSQFVMFLAVYQTCSSNNVWLGLRL